MARKATKAGGKAPKPKKAAAKKSASRSSGGAGDAFIKLLQSPLVADLVAVAATAALASLAEHSRSGEKGKKGAGKAVTKAGKAAASAIGRRLNTEIDEIKKASKSAKGGAKA
jgi:hypothetical protein